MSLRPWYNKDANYQTNAKSFMDYLARTNKFIADLIEDYENFQELVNEELERMMFDSEEAVDDILVNWLEDGTLERIINDEVFGNKADQSELDKVKNRTQITPDDFEGTDIEKMQQVFDYAIENKIVKITLTRSYDLTGGSIYFPQGVKFPFVPNFEGGEIVKNDEGYVFTSLDSNNQRTGPSFVNTHFYSTSDNCYLFDGNKSIRQTVENCRFWKMGLIKTDSYVQTLRVINCETHLLGCDFIKATMAYDFEMAFHKGESTVSDYSLINIVTDEVDGISFMSLRITDCLIEGYVTKPPIILGSGYGLKINGLYCEANNTSIVFRKGVGVDRLAGEISNCIFTEGLGDVDVVFEGITNFTYLVFKNITSNIPSSKTFTNSTSSSIKYENINLYAGGQFTGGVSDRIKYSTYRVQQIDKSADGIEFEVKLNLKNQQLLTQQINKQFLFNAKFVYGGSPNFSAHLTGILSVDGYFKDNETIFGLNVDVLSERNTSGNVNGNVSNPTTFDYYFKETGNKEASPAARELTVVFKFAKGNYNASSFFNHLTFKPLNEILAEGIIDK